MSILIILGNKNQYTFANSIVAANKISYYKFNEYFEQMFIIHSEESYLALREDNKEWLQHLTSQGIDTDRLVDRTIKMPDIDKYDDWNEFEVNFRNNTDVFVDDFVKYIRRILRGNSGSDGIIVDLTNGTTHYKNLLSTASYVLNIENQFMIDISRFPKGFNFNTFINIEDIEKYYIPAPNNVKIDSIAHINLSEVIRYKDMTTRVHTFDNNPDFNSEFFRENLINSIKIKLEADHQDKNSKILESNYRISSSSLGANIENIAVFICNSFGIENTRNRTLGERLNAILDFIEDRKIDTIDTAFMRSINNLMLHIRNSTVHVGKYQKGMQNIRADIAISLYFPFVKFYLEQVYPALLNHAMSKKEINISEMVHDDVQGEMMYFGLDGDNIGVYLEEGLSNNRGDKLKRLSNIVSKTIKDISSEAKKKFAAEIIFDSGDGLLFKAPFSEKLLKFIKETFDNKIQFSTCSVGYGPSIHEAYLALKLAKSKPGKNSVVGIRIVKDQDTSSSSA
jgi:hypothetical protein